MGERFSFVGPGLTPEKKAIVTKVLAHSQEKENIFHKAELKKTSQELAAIALADELFKREFVQLGIAAVPELQPERFHIMSDEWFAKEVPKTSEAQYCSFDDKAVFNRNRSQSNLSLYQALFHEGVHAVSHQKHWVDEEKMGAGYRIGYGITNHAEKVRHSHFRGFNEGVTEGTIEYLFGKYSSEIKTKLDISDGEMQKIGFVYRIERAVVEQLCNGLAAARLVDRGVIWQEIMKGQFTGEMMFLRDLEFEVYDKGALRVLDALRGTSDISSQQTGGKDENMVINEKVLEYFRNYNRENDNDDRKNEKHKKRAALAREILGDEMYQKYCV